MKTTYYTLDGITGKTLKVFNPPVRIDGRTILHPTAEQYALFNAYTLATTPVTPPTPPEGKVAVFDGYEVKDSAWVRTWRYEDAPPPPPKVYSTSDLIYALMERGVYGRCREWIEEQGLRDLILATKEFTDDLENFETIKDGLQELLGWTDEQVAEVLAEAEVG